LKCSINFQELVLEYNEFVGLDEDARVKAKKKREEANKRIAIRNSKAMEKALQRVTKKTTKTTMKEEGSSKEKNSRKTSKPLVVGSFVVD